MPKVSIIPSDEFRRQANRLQKKHKTLADDLVELQRMLLANPFIGTDLGGGKRKIRPYQEQGQEWRLPRHYFHCGASKRSDFGLPCSDV